MTHSKSLPLQGEGWVGVEAMIAAGRDWTAPLPASPLKGGGDDIGRYC
jgi:hypothetical protein